MTIQEMYDKAMEIFEENGWQYEEDEIGLRFENKNREVGDSVENSRHNIDREDEREFPEYGTKEYEEMFELDGASAWHQNAVENVLFGYGARKDGNLDAQTTNNTEHAYIIVGNWLSYDHDELQLDQGEVVIENAKVLHKFY